jgi:hypothetical protein
MTETSRCPGCEGSAYAPENYLPTGLRSAAHRSLTARRITAALALQTSEKGRRHDRSGRSLRTAGPATAQPLRPEPVRPASIRVLGHPMKYPGAGSPAMPYTVWPRRAAGYLADYLPVFIIVLIGASIHIALLTVLFVLAALAYTVHDAGSCAGRARASARERWASSSSGSRPASRSVP